MDPSWDIKHIFSIPISTPFPTWNEPGTPPFSPRRNRISVSRRCGTLCSVAFFPSVRGDWNDERRATRNATRDATRRGLNAERSREPRGVNSKVENWIEQMVMIGCRDMFSLLCVYIYIYTYNYIVFKMECGWLNMILGCVWKCSTACHLGIYVVLCSDSHPRPHGVLERASLDLLVRSIALISKNKQGWLVVWNIFYLSIYWE